MKTERIKFDWAHDRYTPVMDLFSQVLVDIRDEDEVRARGGDVYYVSWTGLTGAGWLPAAGYVKFGQYLVPHRGRANEKGSEVFPGAHIFVPVHREKDGGETAPHPQCYEGCGEKVAPPTILRVVDGESVFIGLFRRLRIAIQAAKDIFFGNLRPWMAEVKTKTFECYDSEGGYHHHEWHFYRESRLPGQYLGGVNCEWFLPRTIPAVRDGRRAAREVELAAKPWERLLHPDGPKFLGRDGVFVYLRDGLIRRWYKKDPRTLTGPLGEGWISDGRGTVWKRYPEEVKAFTATTSKTAPPLMWED